MASLWTPACCLHLQPGCRAHMRVPCPLPAEQVLLGLLFLPPILAAFTAILQRSSPYVGLYLWAFLLALQLFIVTVYPTVGGCRATRAGLSSIRDQLYARGWEVGRAVLSRVGLVRALLCHTLGAASRPGRAAGDCAAVQHIHPPARRPPQVSRRTGWPLCCWVLPPQRVAVPRVCGVHAPNKQISKATKSRSKPRTSLAVMQGRH